MTFPETITPTASTEPTSQYCTADPFGLDDIPDFLRRASGKTLARYAASHGFRVKPMDGGIIVYIPWVARDGSTGETGETARTMAELRNVLGY